MTTIILCLLIGYIVGRNDGFIKAHKTIATECERQGSFFVRNKTFKCVKIEEKKTK